ncbi:hemerythrin domain-containing protein [Nannocystis pusilla]|uniref:Hemerythrin domain-containing protein n=1 Tax=Nannocystis pusilla TaxID=889268 RepID=A0ABS7TK85_9BACT|nr:hemerythrin domain-containing protein [Nannocystis pusilla]MBZ5708626.1 hemerythrin domain-containing protein [Nannocystis pusilla]
MNKPQIYEILKLEHDEVGELFHQLEEAKGSEAGELLNQIRLKLVPHSRAEEAVFYSRLLEEKTTGDKIRESLEEHRQVDLLLEELDAATTRDADWAAKARVLADMVGHHVDEEEGELFPLAQQVLGAKEAQQLARQYEAERDQIVQSMLGEERGAAE